MSWSWSSSASLLLLVLPSFPSSMGLFFLRVHAAPLPGVFLSEVWSLCLLRSSVVFLSSVGSSPALS